MNKTEQAQQLRLAAELIETGHPWQRYSHGARNWINSEVPIAMAIAHGDKIRPILATPPDNRPLHNPDKLTAEQVGVGYRLALIDEKTNENEALQEFWNKGEWMTSGRVYSDTFGEAPNHRITYRLPLTVPWPEVKADPYAELKAAHAEGKAIETQMPNGEWFDYNPGDPQWNLQPECYRIKPEPFQLPPPPISWRYAETTKTVKLGPEDVPPCSAVKGPSDGAKEYAIVCGVGNHGIILSDGRVVNFDHMESHGWKINRSIPLTGRWNPTLWEPCHKTISSR